MIGNGKYRNPEKLRDEAMRHVMRKCVGRASSALVVPITSPEIELSSRRVYPNETSITFKPINFNPGRSLENGSKRARFEKIASEFALLRDRVLETTSEKGEKLCAAVFLSSYNITSQ